MVRWKGDKWMSGMGSLCMQLVAVVAGFILCALSHLTAADPADWTEFAPKEATFSLKFPAKPVSGKAGRGEKAFRTERAIANDMAYTLYWRVRDMAFTTPAEKDAYILGQQKGVAASGKLIAEEDLSLDGNKGREFTVTINPDTTVRCRVFVIERVVCTLTIQGKTPEAVKAADAETFFKSFKPVRDKGK
jgi:hypothetical protein